MSSSAARFLAECSSTGTLTSPKLIAPFHNARAMGLPGSHLRSAPGCRGLRLLLRLLGLALGRGAARGGAIVPLGIGGLLGAALHLVAVDPRLLHARVLGFALLVVALLLGDLVGGLGLGFLHLLLGLDLVLGVLGVELGLGDLLLAFRLGHADVLGVGLHAVALRLVGLGLLLDRFLFHVLDLAVGRGRGLLRALGIWLGRGSGLRLRGGRESERHGQRDAGEFQLHGLGSSLSCYGLLSSPATSETRKRTTNTTNRILAISAAPAAMPVKPKTAAMMAMMKNASAQLNMTRLLEMVGLQRKRSSKLHARPRRTFRVRKQVTLVATAKKILVERPLRR